MSAAMMRVAVILSALAMMASACVSPRDDGPVQDWWIILDEWRDDGDGPVITQSAAPFTGTQAACLDTAHDRALRVYRADITVRGAHGTCARERPAFVAG